MANDSSEAHIWTANYVASTVLSLHTHFLINFSATQIPQGMLIYPHFIEDRVETWKTEPSRYTAIQLVCGTAMIFTQAHIQL